MRFAFFAFVVLTAGSCAHNPVSPSVPTGREFEIKVGDSVSVQGADFDLRFSHVAQDSRCPADAVCVWAGDAEAVFAITRRGSPASPVSLHTEPSRGQQATVGDWTLTLSTLQPYPYSGRPVAASDYKAMLRVDPAR
jgi:hypothetical protein